MRVLIIKTSSLGDVVHTLPALTDAENAIPGIKFDWVVEEGFAAIPGWHNAVDRIIPVALRRWRKTPFASTTRQQWRDFKECIKATDYDLVIDAQGLLKSAWLTRQAKGISHGLDRRSAREGLVSLFYDVRHPVSRQAHAIDRLRQLFASALGYACPDTDPEYGITIYNERSKPSQLVFLHGTSWASKHWPEGHWLEMIRLTTRAGYRIQIPWGNDAEHQRAQRLAASSPQAEVSPAMDLNALAALLASSSGAVAVDTGLGHLAAAIALPTVSLYGSTDPSLTGTRGRFQAQLAAAFDCAPCLHRECSYKQPATVSPACYQSLQPEQVWVKLQQIIQEKETT